MKLPGALLFAVLAALVASGVSPHDRGVWWAEVMPVLIAVPILVASARRFPLTPLAYCLIAFFSLILILGGAYTYARVPIGFVVQDWLDLARNPYDRFGHFFQGVTPAILGRELLLRNVTQRVQITVGAGQTELDHRKLANIEPLDVRVLSALREADTSKRLLEIPLTRLHIFTELILGHND